MLVTLRKVETNKISEHNLTEGTQNHQNHTSSVTLKTTKTYQIRLVLMKTTTNTLKTNEFTEKCL